MRFSNQAKIGIVLPISSAVDTRDEKFSKTPEDCKQAGLLFEWSNYQVYGIHQPYQTHYFHPVVTDSRTIDLSNPNPAMAGQK